jgi:acetyl esterase/lipase
MLRRFALKTAILTGSAILSACSPLEAVDFLVPNGGFERSEDIAYGPDGRHKLDVYRPMEPDAKRTVVVFFYGGGWKSGARQDYRFAAEAFAARGYVTVVPDYRLYPQVRFPAFIEDAARALAWVRRNASDFGGDPDRLVLVGHSAGAHSAAMIALDVRYLEAAGVPETAILGVVGLAGPYSFDPTTYPTTKEIFATARRPDDARPLAFARADAPPMLLIHGLKDTTVEPRNSEALAEALRDRGAAVRYLPLPDVSHTGILLALASTFEGLGPILPEALAFIQGLPPRN